jgi:hypothetical protein
MDAGAATRRSLALGTALVLVTAFHVVLLIARLPMVHGQEGWFWSFRRTELPGLWPYLPIAASAVAAALFVMRRRSGLWVGVALVVLAGWSVQLSFGLMEGKGLQGIQDRMVTTGHAGFAREALRTDDYLEVARNYEYLLAQHRLNGFCATKPPGQLLVYWLTLRASKILDVAVSGIGRFTRLTIFAALAWPLMTYLVCLPLPLIGGAAGRRSPGGAAAILFSVAPNVTLVTLHLDQCLYPLLAALPVLLALHALRRRAKWAAGLAGVTLYLGLYVSFSLLPLLLLIGLLGLLVPAGGRQVGRRGSGGDLLAVARERAPLAAIFVASLALADVVFRLALDYDIARRYAGVIDAHLAWKHVSWTLLNVRHYALLDLAEFALWSGLPIVLLFLARAIRAIERADRRVLRPGDALVIATTATLLAMAILGRTAAETGRLWIYMVPFLCVGASEEIAALGRSRGRAVLWAAVFCQLALVLATKRYQDFF